MSDCRPARYTSVELAHAEALIEHLAADREDPAVADLRACAIRWRDAEVGKLKGLICQKCQGMGKVQWRHRYGGICFLCRGDGWTARGRRKAQK
jgi:hypothetical protein